MTRSGPDGVDHSVDVLSLHALLRLALGAVPLDVVSWPRVHALAERERLLGVAWRASAETIRHQAPAEVSAKWQRQAVQLGLHAERQLLLLADAAGALVDASVDVIALKGAALAQRVYGDFTVRPSLDLDLYVPPSQRPIASRVMSEMGWHSTTGVAPEEETFTLVDERTSYRLEVHSSALDDPLLHHVRIPMESQPMPIGSYVIPAHSGRFMPAYLAAHLAKHNEKPLLWILDFFRLWSSLSATERATAVGAAKQVGLARHLQWALTIARRIGQSELDVVPATPALRQLGRDLAPMRESRRLLRLLSLSSSPSAALQVLGGRIWPAPTRTGWRRAPAYFARRAISWTYRRLVFERPSAIAHGDSVSMAISFSAPDSARRLVDDLRSGEAWITPADGSMEPAIPAFGAVRVIPFARRGLRVGDVIVRQESGRAVLRRVMSLGNDVVRARPDALLVDETIPIAAIVGLCDLVDVGNRRVPIESRPYGMTGLLRAIVRARLTTLLPTRGG